MRMIWRFYYYYCLYLEGLITQDYDYAYMSQKEGKQQQQEKKQKKKVVIIKTNKQKRKLTSYELGPLVDYLTLHTHEKTIPIDNRNIYKTIGKINLITVPCKHVMKIDDL